MPGPRVAVAPISLPFVVDAVAAGGGEVVDAEARPDALVWMDAADPYGLLRTLALMPDVRWVQLPFAGVEPFVEAGVVDPWRAWTCAKRAYAEPVAEHALALALAGLRHLPERVRATSWGAPAGTSLFGARVTILGGGGITTALLAMLTPLRVQATVVRRTTAPVPGAARVVTPDALLDAIPGSLVVFLALALTPETTGIIGAEALAAMDDGSWLVNVARGRHVHTDALVAALRSRPIGAALDVTDPEPLPEGHPLWALGNCIVTPHTADTFEMVQPLLAERITTNVRRFAAGAPLVGVVDPVAGY